MSAAAVNNAAHMYPSSVPLIAYWNVLHANKQTSSVQYITVSLWSVRQYINLSNLDEYTVYVFKIKLYNSYHATNIKWVCIFQNIYK